MDAVKMKTRLRTGKGKAYTRRIRREGWVPAVYYGREQDTRHIEVEGAEVAAMVRARRTAHLIELDIPGEKDASMAVIKEIQRHVVKDDFFYNVDFQHVAMDEKVTVDCPIRIVGIAVGVADEGGVLQRPVRTVAVECLPVDIPDHIEVDISQLHIGDSIHVGDLSVRDVLIKDSPEEVLAVVVHAQVVEEVPEEPEEGAEVGKEGEASGDKGAAGEGEADKVKADKKGKG